MFNAKKYIAWTLIGLFLSYGLIIASVLGFFPLNRMFFFLILLIILVGAFLMTKEFFWLLIICLPLENIILSGDYLPFSLRPFQIIGGALMLTLLIKIIFYEKYRQKINFNKWDILVLILPLLSLIGSINSPNKIIVFKQSLILFSFGLLYLVARYFLQKKKDFFEAIWFFFIGSEVVLLFGLYQAIARKVSWPDLQVMVGRINSTFTEPDWLAMYAVLLMALILFLKLTLLGWRKNIMFGSWEFSKAINWLLKIYFFLAFWVLFLTVARSGWVAFFVLILVYFAIIIFRNNFEKQHLAQTQNLKVKIQNNNLKFEKIIKEFLLIAGMIISVVIITEIFNLSSFHFLNRATSSLSGWQKITISCQNDIGLPERITALEELKKYNCRHIDLEEIDLEKSKGYLIKEIYRLDPNINIRKNIYLSSWEKVKEHPILGYGLGSSSLFLGQDERGSGLNASNIFLESWLSFGIFGLLIIISLIFYPIVVLLNKLIKKKEAEGIALFTILTWAAILIPNFFNSGLLLGFFWIWLAGIKGLEKI